MLLRTTHARTPESTIIATSWGLDLVRDDQAWRQAASCFPSSAEWFWPTVGAGRAGGVKLTADNKAALELCRTCPVLDECDAYERRHPTSETHIAAGRVWVAESHRRRT